MPVQRLQLAAALALGFGLVACSPSPSPTATQQSGPTHNERAASDLKLYKQMLVEKKYALAAPIGEGILKRAPRSIAAAEVQKTIEATREKAHAINEKRRLAALWLYQSGEQSGGHQDTATIYPSRPAKYNRRIRLIFREHSDWGTSVYLYDTGDKGFVCGKSCKLPLKVDGKAAEPLKASTPPSGEPAVFIDSQKRMLELVDSAKTLAITIDVKGDWPQELYYEVGGFDPERWPPTSKTAKQ